MKEQDQLPPHAETLLRAPLPGTKARPGFETRLLTNVREASPTPSLVPRLFTGAVCSLLLLGLLFALNLREQVPTENTTATPPTGRPVLEVSKLPNPLEAEARAMRSTATRAGRFLLSHLPSLPESSEAL